MKSIWTLMLVGLSVAAPIKAHAADTSEGALYAVNAAALAAAITHCTARHGELQQGSPGAACFVRARGILGTFGLKQRSTEVASRCKDPAQFNTCLTPEIARMTHALNAEFAKSGI
ncbi:hypothetical protein ABRP17_007145 [Stenotrophomonas sp. WHRI 8082]|uniref:hypothetical protein n=1 Tax=Stenotrophomonas sp. WHRI 8082 TaxID=3162571 RepID=UPI0032F02809